MMNRISIATCLFALATLPAAARGATRFDAIVEPYVQAQQFMGAVLVARGDEILFDRAYGFANLEWSVPNTTTTRFRVGSITKQVTAAAVLKLEERGAWRVDDPIGNYLPDVPAAWRGITLAHLLTHTAGIPDLTELPEFHTAIEPYATTPEQLVNWLRGKPIEFAAGERYQYSNSGYVLLGHLLERVTRTGYGAFVREHIFAPAGMTDSGYDTGDSIVPRLASGYVRATDGLTTAPFLHMSVANAAGAMYSSTHDLLRWTRALFDGCVVSRASLTRMTTPFKSDYGFGVGIRTDHGRTMIVHDGDIEGFGAALVYLPAARITVAVLGNVGGTPAPLAMAVQLADAADVDADRPQPPPQAIPVPRATLGAYVGVYAFTPAVKMTITLEGDHLYAQMSGQARLAVYPESDTSFFLKEVDAKIEFVRDDTGAVTHVVLHQGGHDQRAARTSASVTRRQPMTVAPAVLAIYVGVYPMRPGFDLVITIDDDHLVVTPTGQPPQALVAESETRFFLDSLDAQFEFEVDAGGSATKLTLDQGPVHLVGARK